MNIEIEEKDNKEEENKYNIYIDWMITRSCNFKCEYCAHDQNGGGGLESKVRVAPVDIPRIIKRINKINGTILFSFTGGEPFLVPNFTELIVELSQNHLIAIDTNFSQRWALNKFLTLVNPKNILKITFSPHMLERERTKEDLEELCLLINKFQKRGFKILGNYVAYPPLIERMASDIDFFKNRGIDVYVSLFSGQYKNRNYPVDQRGVFSYTEKELELIKPFIIESDLVDFKTKDSLCLAGSRAFAVSGDIVSPCWKIPINMGDFWDEWETFDKVIKCPVPYCHCPYNSDSVANLPGMNLQTRLLNTTIKELGVYSMTESKKISRTSVADLWFDKYVGLIGLFIKNHFPAVYYYLKKNI